MSETDGRVTWFEVPAGDTVRARGFYSLLFGWTFTPFDSTGDYNTTTEGGGAVYNNPEGKGIVVYFGTSDIDASVAKVRELGGESAEPMEIPNVGRYATCSDTEGNAFGLYQAGWRTLAAAAPPGGGHPPLSSRSRVSANPPLAAKPESAPARPGMLHRHRWAIWGLVLAVGVAAAAGLALLSRSHSSATGGGTVISTWAAGQRPAPGFSLVDQHGALFTLASLRGRPVIVTFIDPLCRDFCPREATVLTEAAAQLGAQAPAIVSVSVNPWADSRANFAVDAVHWKLAPSWRWGTGSYGRLSSVWQDYGVAVAVSKKTIAGITVRRITHTGAAYLIDADGNERALFLYPFTTGDVVDAAKKIRT